jgi:hypothetical protein
MLVLSASSGPDPAVLSIVPSHLDFDAATPIKGLRVGYFPQWLDQNPATQVDKDAVEHVKKLGMTPVEVQIPNWPYDCMNLILFAEGAAAFEELTLSGGMNKLKAQVPTRGQRLPRSASCRQLTSWKPIACAAKSLRKWRSFFREWTFCWFRRCATKCSPSRTSLGIHR